MYKNFFLTEQEKKEILEMHGKHGYKKPLNEDVSERQQNINNTWCSTVNGVINNPNHYMNGKKFEDYKKSNQVTDDEWRKAGQSCPKHKENYASIPTELKDKEGVKLFQDWLDAYKPGWAEGHPGGKLNKRSGYGTYGPRTSKAWNTHKGEYKP